MTVCALFVDRAIDADGATIYENRAMFLLRGKWGKVTSQEDFLDTQKVAAFDEAPAGRLSGDAPEAVHDAAHGAGAAGVAGLAATPSVIQHQGLGPLM